MVDRTDDDVDEKGLWILRCLASALAFVVLAVGLVFLGMMLDGQEHEFLALAWTFLALSILPLAGAVGVLVSWLWGMTDGR